MKFRKRPVVIEAEQWFPGKNVGGVQTNTVQSAQTLDGVWRNPGEYGTIYTLEGIMAVTPGDWVITGVNGEKYPCKPDIFEKTYEKVEE